NCGCEPCPDGLDSNWLFDCTCPIPQRDACAEMGLGINEDDCSCEPCPEGQQINDGSCSCTHVDCGEGVWPDTHCECGGDGCPEGKEPVGDHCLCEDRCEDHECDLGESYDYTTCECEAPTCDDEALPTMCAEEGPEGGVAAFSCCPEGDPCNGSWCTL
nr:hypothetical protein [Deltaproteobacteria bacterium]